LNLVIVHFHTGWLFAQQGSFLNAENLASDVRSFFSLPIPKAIWIETKEGRDSNFVKFVESCLS
ncbi:MAG: hypothetical protein L0Z50_23920, partial [Verrucomicrobiales bacterium]|nr:hypothetical protein [Verrucomicrobiales bacterium]